MHYPVKKKETCALSKNIVLLPELHNYKISVNIINSICTCKGINK